MTLSKEKFEHILAYAKQQQKLGVHHCNILPDDMVEIMEMAAGKMERRERDKQEPYGYVHQSIYEDCGSSGLSNDHEAYRNSTTHIPLYKEPPAPVVPEELLTAMEEVLRISDRQHDAWDSAKAAITTLRAAPKSFGNSEQLNSPVIPDGWQLVPIEPTAEMCKAFDYSNAWKEVDFWEGSFDLASGWRAMLAAAPKLES